MAMLLKVIKLKKQLYQQDMMGLKFPTSGRQTWVSYLQAWPRNEREYRETIHRKEKDGDWYIYL